MKKLFISAFLALTLILSGCGSGTSDGKSAANKEEAPKDERINNIEEAFDSHKTSVEKMNQAKEFAQKGDEEKARGSVEAASMFSEMALNALDELPPKDQPDFIEYQSSVLAQLKIYAAAIDGVKELTNKGISTKKAFDEFYDKKTGAELKKLEELENKLKDLK